jgi:hypothetical protein
MITTALDKSLGIDILDKAIITIQEAIEKSGGTLTVKMKVCKNKKKNFFQLKNVLTYHNLLAKSC